MKKNKIVLGLQNASQIYATVLDQYSERSLDFQCNTEDGVKFYNNSEWLHIRASNTEPAVRIIAESKNEERTDQLIALGRKLLARVENI
jgi:phosphomannomutase